MAVGLLGTAALGMWSAGLWINTTPSFPIGLYRRVEPGSNAAQGDLVLVCLPREQWLREPRWSLRCPDGARPILKKIIARPNDRVGITPEGVRVNGRIIPNSQPLPGVVAQTKPGPVPEGMFWALSDHSPNSYDSRYFGPLPLTAIRAVVRPLLVF